MKKNPILWAMLAILLALSLALVLGCDNGGGGGGDDDDKKVEQKEGEDGGEQGGPGGPGGAIDEAVGEYTAEMITAIRAQAIFAYDQAKGFQGAWEAIIDGVNETNGTNVPKTDPRTWTSQQVADFAGN